MYAQTFDLFIFDFDGTLGDSKHNIANSLNFALRQGGYAPVEPERIHRLIGKLRLPETFTHFYPSLTPDQLANLIDHFRQYQRQNLMTELTLFPEVTETLHELKARGKYLAILTSKHMTQMSYILDQLRLSHLFDVVCGDGLLAHKKPHLACTEYIWRSLPTPISPEQSVMIGDSEVDVQTAQNAGIAMIAVGHGTDSLETLVEGGANHTISSLSDVLRFASISSSATF